MPAPATWPRKLYAWLIEPHAKDEDTRRRESIFNILLLGLLGLTLAAVFYQLGSKIIEGSTYAGLSPLSLSPVLLIVLAMYIASRRRFHTSIVYLFVALYLVLGTYALYAYSYALPEGILTYVLVIIIAGILISNRAAVGAIIVVLGCLGVLSYLQTSGVTHPDLRNLTDPIHIGHIVIYFFFFGVIFLVSWLSNRDIERSLDRARSSEAALRKERNLLEVKVRERTQELEKAQVEKMQQLQRFAEFGRLSSTLLHDLANPLTSVSIELEQLADSEHSQLVTEARKGIASMERYVEAARRQLRNQSEVKLFNVADEVRRVEGFLESKARAMHATILMDVDDRLELYGDSARFSQIIANLVANAIDAYEDLPDAPDKPVIVTVKPIKGVVRITVEDKAVGIDKKDLKRIFEAFYTTKAADRGSGLGLSITKRTIEEDFGGTISVKSTKGEGTCFTVKLPKP